MGEDWESVKARLEKTLLAWPTNWQDEGDTKDAIRAALERVDHYESAFDRGTEWIKEHLPDTPSGPLILDVLRQRVEELERLIASVRFSEPVEGVLQDEGTRWSDLLSEARSIRRRNGIA